MAKEKLRYSPIVLAILDGWGLSPSWGGNAISMNNPQTMDMLWRSYPHKILQALLPLAGPSGRVGNSVIGHSCIGSGRLVEQDSTIISNAIHDGIFFRNLVLTNEFKELKKSGKNLHLVGMLSDGWIHSHIDHLLALLDMAKQQGLSNVFIHLITDGTDSPATAGLQLMMKLVEKTNSLGIGKIATISGRYYAMDRDNNWDRTALAYQAMVVGAGEKAEIPTQVITNAYNRGYTDTNIPPTVIVSNNKPVGSIKENDTILFFNFRADRMRQMVRAFLDPTVFKKLLFWRTYRMLNVNTITLSSYRLNYPIKVAFPPKEIKNHLAEVLSANRLKQLHIAETEKYAHVTYFFNGGVEKAYQGEERIFIPSPKLTSFDLKPEMSSKEITDHIIGSLGNYQFVVVNYGNVDLVGHSGNILAAGRAIQAVDQCVDRLYKAIIQKGGALIITADHGNAEQMVRVQGNEDNDTDHTLNPVPFILVTGDNKKSEAMIKASSSFNMLSNILGAKDTLADVAPTILELFNFTKPAEMTGQSLLGRLE